MQVLPMFSIKGKYSICKPLLMVLEKLQRKDD